MNAESQNENSSLGQLSQTRKDIKTWFEAGELDDYASFAGKP
jgi:hypothetical protein